VTREEARQEATRRNAQPSADTAWIARRRQGDDWQVVRLRAPGLAASQATGAHVEAKPRPPEPDDPRPAVFRNIPPYGAG
jgi:hypothetical protein